MTLSLCWPSNFHSHFPTYCIHSRPINTTNHTQDSKSLPVTPKGTHTVCTQNQKHTL